MLEALDVREDYAAQALSGVRAGRFDVSFCRRGVQTRIQDRYISYPFHMTRPFQLDAQIPHLLTLYQQSSSGGLYQGDSLSSAFVLGEGAAAYLTSQSATIVHHSYERPCHQATNIRAARGSFFISVPDSVILFPGAWLESSSRIIMCPQAHLFLHESFTWHDPHKNGGARQAIFKSLSSQLQVEDEEGQIIVRDAFRLKGEDVLRPSSPVGEWALCSTFLLLGEADKLPQSEALAAELQLAGQIAGCSRLPNDAGFFIRSLSKSAKISKILVERLSNLVARAYFGASLAVRRK